MPGESKQTTNSSPRRKAFIGNGHGDRAPAASCPDRPVNCLVKPVTAPGESIALASLSLAFGAAVENRQKARVRAPIQRIGVPTAVHARGGNRADSGVPTRLGTSCARQTAAQPEQIGR
jgi:hypothetical protein